MDLPCIFLTEDAVHFSSCFFKEPLMDGMNFQSLIKLNIFLKGWYIEGKLLSHTLQKSVTLLAMLAGTTE